MSALRPLAGFFSRGKLVSPLVIVLGLLAILAVTALQRHSSDSRDAQMKLAAVTLELNKLQGAPFRASADTGGSPAIARGLLRTGKSRIGRTLDDLERRSPPPALLKARAPLRDNYATLDKIYALGASGAGYGKEADALLGVAGAALDATTTSLDAASRDYDRRAELAQQRATVGSSLVILLLLGAFGYLYRRSSRARSLAERLVDENRHLLSASQKEARVDELTGLRNRRALTSDLSTELPRATAEDPMLLALFDLDGFKQYNDTFGHPAGDNLLSRLGERLTAAMDGRATAYRMGGDEFCVLTGGGAGQEEIARLASAALSETGNAFSIGCSYGVAWVPTEATSMPRALRLADQRMYEHKAGRSSASRQSTDVLLKVLSERRIDSHEYADEVARLALGTAERLGLPEHEAKRIELAAELHDVGKTAIPDAILNKPGKLDDEEWRFMRRHTVIGERIVLAAPSLAHAADLVRSSHERWDGAGYPDSLEGEQIPVGARIIAVCDAFDAMVTEKPYSAAMPLDDALAELRRCSGTQFHRPTVEAFCALVNDRALVLG